MDIFSQVVCDFFALPSLKAWQEAQALFQQAAARKPAHWLILLHACEAVGGTREQAMPAILATGCAHIGILLVDDMLDDDPRGDYHRIGMSAASNLACAFQAAALQAIDQCLQDPTSKMIILNSFNEMFLSTALGQFVDADSQSPVEEAVYWKIVQMKSSPFFGATLQVGALAGGGNLNTARQLKRLGCIYGEMIQIHDDMHDAMETPANPDWVQGRSPLPIIFASSVYHPEQERFLTLQQKISEPTALQEAQEILIRCGAISYCIDQLIQKYSMAKEILNEIALINPVPISSLLDEIIAPVDRLLEETVE